MATEGRVLSIQSHVVRGYVGNKCSVFTLQLLGFDVDPVNSVQFSNHTGYRTFKGTVLQGTELTSLVEGLEANELLEGYTHMLTGYIGSPSFLRAVLGAYRTLKDVNPDLLFICDPVLGDEGRLYVPAENVNIYREEVLPLASMLTPNQFEAEILSGIKISTQDDAVRACLILHGRGPDTVVITSCRLQGEGHSEDDIVLIASSRRQPCLQSHAHEPVLPQESSSRDASPVPPAPPALPQDGNLDWKVDDSPDPKGGIKQEGAAPNKAKHLSVFPAAGHGREIAAVGGQEVVADAAADSGLGDMASEGDDAVRRTHGEEETGAESGTGEPIFDVYKMTFPRLPQQFTGTGDLTAALLLAWTHRLPGDLAGALENVAGTIRAVLKRTHAEGSAELLLIESKGDIERPPLEVKAITIPGGPKR